MPALRAPRAHEETISPRARVVCTHVALLVALLFSRTAALAQTVPGSSTTPPPLATPQPFATPQPLASASPPASDGAAGGATAQPLPSPSPTAPTGRRLAAFSLAASNVDFYSSRYIVGADGNVVVTLGDGTRITGNTFAMDLRLNRFIVAGNVVVTAGGTTQHGAAFSEFFDFDRAYFVPVTTEPDRWTFVTGDYAHPLLGRQMPGDAFALPDLSGDRIFLTATHATIDPKQSVRFTPASLNFGLNTFVRFPAYFLSFSPNPNFAQNSLTGAYVDGPLDLVGGEHGLATAHLRYDSSNKLYPAVELHQVSDNSYFVGSVSPLTRPLKEYNLLAFDRVSPGVQVQVALQETTFQHGFTQPLSATGYANIQITGSLPHSYLQLSTQSYYDSLLGRPAPGIDGLLYYGDPTHNWVGDHPVNLQLAWVGNRQRLGKSKLGKFFNTQVRSGVSFAQNTTTPLQTLGNTPIVAIYGKTFGFNLATDSFALVRDASNRPKVYLTGTFDKQRQFFSTPHFIDTQTESFSLTDIVVPRKLTALLSYTNQNTGDFYGSQQSLAYPLPTQASYVDPFTGQIIPEYAAFRGFGTTRSLAQQFVYTPSTDLTFNVSLRENRDFPLPVAGFPTVVGPTTAFNNYGATPYEADLDFRYRFTKALVLDVERSYYFGFGGYERWSPQFFVQLLK